MVLPRERMLFSKAGLPGMYRAVLRFGYQDRIDLGPDFVAALVHEVQPRTILSPQSRIVGHVHASASSWASSLLAPSVFCSGCSSSSCAS